MTRPDDAQQPQAISAQLAGEQIEFFAAITASLTHELKNALATINEYSGLLDDLSATGKPVAPERLRKVCGKVQKQVLRSQQLISRLNRFAHSADAPWVEVEPAALLGALCDLCDRFAKLAQATLERRIPADAPAITSDPFALQHAVYLAIRLALAAASAERRVTVELVPGALVADRPGGGAIVIESADPLGPPDASGVQQQRLARLCEYLGARLEWQADGDPGGAPARIAIVLGS